jgi:large subunit ribosomal protein L31
MRPHIHPEYRKVLFRDLASNTYFLIGSTLATEKQVGKEGQVARFGQRFGQFFSKGKEKQ